MNTPACACPHADRKEFTRINYNYSIEQVFYIEDFLFLITNHNKPWALVITQNLFKFTALQALTHLYI